MGGRLFFQLEHTNNNTILIPYPQSPITHSFSCLHRQSKMYHLEGRFSRITFPRISRLQYGAVRIISSIYKHRLVTPRTYGYIYPPPFRQEWKRILFSIVSSDFEQEKGNAVSVCLKDFRSIRRSCLFDCPSALPGVCNSTIPFYRLVYCERGVVILLGCTSWQQVCLGTRLGLANLDGPLGSLSIESGLLFCVRKALKTSLYVCGGLLRGVETETGLLAVRDGSFIVIIFIYPSRLKEQKGHLHPSLRKICPSLSIWIFGGNQPLLLLD